MKKYIVFLFTALFVLTVALIGCEKKAEAPKPIQPAVAPADPAPVPVPVPVAEPEPPAPAPAPSKPAKK